MILKFLCVFSSITVIGAYRSDIKTVSEVSEGHKDSLNYERANICSL